MNADETAKMAADVEALLEASHGTQHQFEQLICPVLIGSLCETWPAWYRGKL